MKLAILALVLLITAVSLAADNRQLVVHEIDEGVYLHTSYREIPGYGPYPSNGLVVVTGGDAYIIDTPWPEQDTRVLMQWIENAGLELKASISTHFHEDRTAGIRTLNRHNISTHASALTNQLIAKSGGVEASHSFNGDEFALIDGAILAFHPGAGHSRDNIVIWLPGTRTLFGGCLVRELAARSLGNTADADIGGWAQSVQTLIERYPDARTVVPGHGLPGTVALLSHTIALVREHVTALAANTDGQLYAGAGKTPGKYAPASWPVY